MSVTTMTIAQLCVSPFNARTNQADANAITGMAESLLARGQLYPLVVHPMRGKGKKTFGALAGGRRYRAFAQLIEQGRLPADHPIDVIVRDITDEGELREMSLAENLVRVDLRPYEVFAAVARAVEHGRSLKEIADTNGQPVETVRQWARLGQLHRTVFKALEEGAIGQDVARALAATEDQALQLHVFEQLGALPDFQRTPATIRKMLKVGDRELEKLLLFVGEDAYRAAGGRYELDLYADEAQARGRVVDEGLLRQLTEAKLEAGRETLRDQTGRALRFEKQPPMSTFAGYDNGVAQDLEIVAEPVCRDQRDADRRDYLINEMTELEAIAARTLEEPLSQEAKDRLIAGIDEDYLPLEKEREAIEARMVIDLPDGDVFATLTIQEDGSAVPRFWWTDRKAKRKHEEAQRRQPGAASAAPVSAKPIPAANRAAGRAALNKAMTDRIGDGEAISNTGYNARQNADAAIRDEHGLTQDGVQAMRSIRREMLRAVLVEESETGTLGQDYLIFQLARHMLAHDHSHQLGAVGLWDTGLSDAGARAAQPHVERTEAHRIWQAALDQLKAHRSMTQKDLCAGFRAWRDETEAWKIEAAAIVAGLALERSANAPGYNVPLHDLLFAEAYTDDAMLRALADPTEELIGMMPRAERLKLVHPHVSHGEYLRLEKLKAAELTAPVVRALKKAESWVHPLLRFGPPPVHDPESQKSGKPERQPAEAAA